MAIEKIIDINIQGNADQAVGSLRSQLRQAQAEVALISDKFGVTSIEAANAAKKAAELKDRIGDAKSLTDAFNPDAKFKSLTSSLSGVAGGFAAVQGGMVLFGAESEDVQKTLLKVQSAMALSQGLQGLGEAKDSFKQLGAVANDVFKSIKVAIGSTGIGLLVLALAAVVTYWDEISKAISGATDETKAYEEANKGVSNSIAKTQESLISVKISIDNAKKGIISKSDALKNYNDKLGEAFGKTDDLNVAEQRMAANTDKYIKAQIARATAQAFVAKAAEAAGKAASGEDLDLSFWDQAKVALLGYGELGRTLANKVGDNQKLISTYQKLAVTETEKADKLTTEINASGINKRYDANKKAQEDSAANKKKNKEEREAEIKKDAEERKLSLQAKRDAELLQIQEITKAIGDAQDKQAEANMTASEVEQRVVKDKYFGLIELAKQQKRSEDEINVLEVQKLKDLQDIKDKFRLQEDEKTAAKLEKTISDETLSFENRLAAVDAEQSLFQKQLDDKLITEEQFNDKTKALSAARVNIDKAEAAAKRALFAKTSDILSKGADLLGKNTAAGKAMAAAAALINTYQGITAELATKTITPFEIGLKIANVAIIAATGFKAVKDILSVQVPGASGGGGGGGGGAQGGSAPSMTAPSFNTVGSSSTNQLAQTIGQQTQTPIKTYVTASDVTTGQALDRSIIKNASI